MPKNIRLSGTVSDDDSKQMRKIRAKLLYHLYLSGWSIYNGNGDQDIHLWNIQRKIKEAHGFVFLPTASLDDLVKATSIFVGYQTGDMDLNNKPTVIMNSENHWDGWLTLISHLHALGTVSQSYEEILQVVEKPKQVLEVLKEREVDVNELRTLFDHKPEPSIPGDPERREPKNKVCVFCSASTKNEHFLNMGYQLGKNIALANFGCISGAGRTGIMGEVVRGAFENGGWTAGSNVPHIIEMEGLPDGLNTFWPRSDIYTRMEVMVERSSAFVVLPGGMGSVQEILVLLQLADKGDVLMKDKPIYLVNVEYEKGKGFWDPLIALSKSLGIEHLIKVVPDETGIVADLQKHFN